MRVIGYLRVSTAGQDYGIDAQRTAIATEAERRSWTVTWVEDAGRWDVTSSPGIHSVLTMLRLQEADALVVSKLDRTPFGSRLPADRTAIESEILRWEARNAVWSYLDS